VLRDILGPLTELWSTGGPVVLATVVATYSSAPRQAGASMLVAADGSVVGSVSGGCVEGAVYELSQQVLADGQPVLQRYGISDDDALGVGLTCGGIIDIFIERIDATSFPRFNEVASAISAGEPLALATVVAGPPEQLGRRIVVRAGCTEGSTGWARLDEVVAHDAVGLLDAGRSGLLRYSRDGRRRGEGLDVFVESFAPPPRMIVFGAIDFAAAMARVGAFLGYRVTVCDARPVFATASRFPDADEVVVEWPHRYLATEAGAGRIDARTALCVLTHDPKFDVPLLAVALRLPDVGYVGAMGSRRTHHDRLKRLREIGLTEREISRMCSPIGLDLGARTPEQTAVSIAAEIVLSHFGGSGLPLGAREGAIHEPDAGDVRSSA
jgi:xanthine dehydrogenase accessory factor